MIKELEKIKKDGDFSVKLAVGTICDGYAVSDGECFWHVFTEDSIPGKNVVISAEH